MLQRHLLLSLSPCTTFCGGYNIIDIQPDFSYIPPTRKGIFYQKAVYSTNEQLYLAEDSYCRRRGKKFDYLICYGKSFPIAIIEAKIEECGSNTGLYAIIDKKT